MLEIRNVKKSFKGKAVLHGLSFSLKPGEITSLIGGNGSGKTTTFRLILNYLEPDEGSISYDERPVRQGDVSYLSEQRSLYQDCKVEEQLMLTARLNRLRDGKNKIEIWLDEFRLTEMKREVIGRLSKGNQQKVALVNCLLSNAPIIIMDEPFTALDRDNIAIFMKTLIRLKEQGKAVLVSSHIYQPVNEICDRFLLLKDGRIQVDVSREELRKREERTVVVSSRYEPQEEIPLDCQKEEGENTRYIFAERKRAAGFAGQALREDEDVIYRRCRIEDLQ